MDDALLALAQITPIDASSAISIGLVITILGATAYLTRAVTKTEEQLRQINEKLGDLKDLPRRMAIVENHISNLETDIGNLWAAYREDPPAQTRRDRGPQHRGRGEDP